jgi:hypothetical protein
MEYSDNFVPYHFWIICWADVVASVELSARHPSPCLLRRRWLPRHCLLEPSTALGSPPLLPLRHLLRGRRPWHAASPGGGWPRSSSSRPASSPPSPRCQRSPRGGAARPYGQRTTCLHVRQRASLIPAPLVSWFLLRFFPKSMLVPDWRWLVSDYLLLNNLFGIHNCKYGSRSKL